MHIHVCVYLLSEICISILSQLGTSIVRCANKPLSVYTREEYAMHTLEEVPFVETLPWIQYYACKPALLCTHQPNLQSHSEKKSAYVYSITEEEKNHIIYRTICAVVFQTFKLYGNGQVPLSND